MSSIIEQLYKSIEDGDFETIFDILKNLFEVRDTELYHFVISLSARNKDIRNKFSQNLVQLNELNVEMAKIREGVLGLISEIQIRGYINNFQEIIDGTSLELQWYLNKLIETFDKVEILAGTPQTGISSAEYPLSKIYLSPKFTPAKEFNLDKEPIKDKLPEEDPIDFFTTNYQGREHLDFFLKLSNKLIVVGEPGTGKTLLCNWLASTLAQKKLHPENQKPNEDASFDFDTLIPVIIKCRDIKNNHLPTTHREFLYHAITFLGVIQKDAEPLVSQLEDHMALGNLLLIIDGLDEVENEIMRIKLCDVVQRLSGNFPKSYFIVTSRVFGFKDIRHRIGAGFKHLRIDYLIKEERVELTNNIANAYSLNNDQKEKLHELLDEPSLGLFVKNPFLLSNLCLVFYFEGLIPQRLDDLYFACINLFFYKISPSHKYYIKFDEAIQFQLAWLAYELQKIGKANFTSDQFIQFIHHARERQFIERSAFINPDEFLEVLTKNIGLLAQIGTVKERGSWKRLYEFRHKNYQEYLCGLALATGSTSDWYQMPAFESVSNLAKSFQKGPSLSSYNNNQNDFFVNESWIEPIKFCFLMSEPEEILILIDSIINHKQSFSTIDQYISVLDIFVYGTVELEADKFRLSFEKLVLALLDCVEEHSESKQNDTIEEIIKKFNRPLWKHHLKNLLVQLLIQDQGNSFQNEAYFRVLYQIFSSESLKIVQENLSYFMADVKSMDTEKKLEFCLVILGLSSQESISNLSIPARFDKKKFINNLFTLLKDSIKPVVESAIWVLRNLNQAYDVPISNYQSQNPEWRPSPDEQKELLHILQNTNNSYVVMGIHKILYNVHRYPPAFPQNYAYDWSKLIAGKDSSKEIELPITIEASWCHLLCQKLESKSQDIRISAALCLAQLNYPSAKVCEVLLKNWNQYGRYNKVTCLIPYIAFLNKEECVPLLVEKLLNARKEDQLEIVLCLVGMRNSAYFEFAESVKNSQDPILRGYDTILKQIISYGKYVKGPNDPQDDYFKSVPDIVVSYLNRLIYNCGGQEEGKHAWYILLADPGKVDMMEFLGPGKSYDLRLYGEIIQSAWGKEIPEETKKMLNKRFQLNF